MPTKISTQRFSTHPNQLSIIGIILLASLAISLIGCSPKDRPSDTLIMESVLKDEKQASPKIISHRKINLDEEPDLESLVLLRNGTTEILASFKFKGEEWVHLNSLKFSLMNIGPFAYSVQDKKWVATQKPEKNEGYIVKKIIAQELPGDNFNSIFIEIMSEEPPLGLFSVPMGYRKGKKILDGLSILKDHPNVKSSKRADFSYNPKDKSILAFPEDGNMKLEFVFNGFEMIPNLSAQPIPAILKIDRKGNQYRVEFKNRGGYNTNTYLTLSFPKGGVVKEITKPDLQAYKKGDSVYSRTKDRFIPAIHPMVEATKSAWGANVRYAIEFSYDCECDDPEYFLFRTSYKYNRNIEMIPNEFSIYSSNDTDQQGFPAYIVPFPKDQSQNNEMPKDSPVK